MRVAPFAQQCDLRPVGVEEARKFAEQWATGALGLPGDPHAVQALSRKQGWSPLRVGRSVSNLPIVIGGRTFEHGFGTHADSEIAIRANQPIQRFRAWVGMDGNPGCVAANKGGPERLIFAVEASGKEMWRSAALGVASPAARVDVAVGGHRELTLKVWDVNGNNGWAHANWANVELELADGVSVRGPAGDGVRGDGEGRVGPETVATIGTEKEITTRNTKRGYDGMAYWNCVTGCGRSRMRFTSTMETVFRRRCMRTRWCTVNGRSGCASRNNNR